MLNLTFRNHIVIINVKGMVSTLFISGSKALDYSNGLYDCQSPTSPFMGNLRALHLLEDLRSVLELMDTEERETLRCQIPDSTADSLVEWLHGQLVGLLFVLISRFVWIFN